MKHLLEYILEYLSTKEVANKPGELKKRSDVPSDWEVGDILKGYYTYSGVIPYFYKIIKKTGSSFTLVRLQNDLVKGYFNTEYEVMPGKENGEKPITKRVNKYGQIQIGSGWAAVTLTLWDGKTPLKGDGRN